MTSPRIKICGLTCVADALLAIELGADAIGLNLFPGSKRHISAELALEIARAIGPFSQAIPLLVQLPLAMALEQAAPLGRILQWHGQDPPLPPPAPWRFIPAFNISAQADLDQVDRYLARCTSHGCLPCAVLLDGAKAGQFGGTGVNAPWPLLAGFRPGVPVILAGGLTPGNVAEAVRTVRPHAVDVAGGVESQPGRKDRGKMQDFIAAVRSAQ